MLQKITAIFFVIFCFKFETKEECLLSKIANTVQISNEIKMNLKYFLEQEDFSRKVDVDSMNNQQLLRIDDFQSKMHLETLLLNYSNLPDELKRAIQQCNLSPDSVKNRCQNHFQEECFELDKFLYTNKCERKLQQNDVIHCATECPNGLTYISNDPFHCEKTVTSKRSSEFKNKQNNEMKNFRDILEVQKCPEGFREIENDLCIARCPQNWIDFGMLCKKPEIKTKDHQIFYYQLLYDNLAVESANNQFYF